MPRTAALRLIAYARTAWEAAQNVELWLEDAVQAYHDRDLDACAEALEAASSLESDWGDDPAAKELRRQLIDENSAQCECAEAVGLDTQCEWSGPLSSTVVIEWMPRHLRASHEAAANCGVYPSNGAVRLRVHHECASRLRRGESGQVNADDPCPDSQWVRLVTE